MEVRYSRTHKSLADELGVSISAVAIIREVARNSSDISARVLAESGGDVVAAARRLAALRRCYSVADSITSEIADAVVAAG